MLTCVALQESSSVGDGADFVVRLSLFAFFHLCVTLPADCYQFTSITIAKFDWFDYDEPNNSVWFLYLFLCFSTNWKELGFFFAINQSCQLIFLCLLSPALKCPPGSSFRSNIYLCRQPSCQDPAGPGGSCLHKPLVEGCVCDDGLILSGHKCVPLKECGCTDEDGKYRLVSVSR